MIEKQTSLALSPYMGIYDLTIPKDNLLWQMNELVNFNFIYDELINVYCQQLITVIENAETIFRYPAVKEKINMLKELVEDDLEQLDLVSKDADTKIGHKTADTWKCGILLF